MRKAIAIDFDGCLCTDAYPSIGEPNWPVIKQAQAEQRAGAGLILWTCREGDLLQEAVSACEGWGLTFDAVNESLQDWIEAFGTRPRKVGATEYWDDKAVRLPVAPIDPLPPMKRLTNRNKHGYVETFWETNTENGMYDMDEDTTYKCLDRLAAYEDTGLEPEEVQIVTEMFAGDPYVPILQASNLVKAYREGKVEILPPNEPLTLDELREMDGEPVWVVPLDGRKNSGWMLVDMRYSICQEVHGGIVMLGSYGKTWLAYRRKPEGGRHGLQGTD